jgi:hypothetical protein
MLLSRRQLWNWGKNLVFWAKLCCSRGCYFQERFHFQQEHNFSTWTTST